MKWKFLWLLFHTITAITIERLPSTNPIPTPRQTTLMETFPDLNIFILYGGYIIPSNAYNDLWSFNFTSFLWEKIYPYDNKYPGIFYIVVRYCGGSFALQSSSAFCIFGGASPYGPLNDIWCFYYLESLWKEIETSGEIPSARLLFGHTSYIENNILYFVIYGGNAASGLSTDLFMLNTTSWVWTKMEQYGDIPSSTLSPNVVYYNNTLFLVATEAGKFYKYDLKTGIWTNLTSENSFEPRIFSKSVIYNDEIYLMAGFSTKINLDDAEWYKANLNDPSYDWSKAELTRMDYELDSYGHAMYNSKVYIFGGSNQTEMVNFFAIFDLETSPIEAIIYDQDVAPDPRMFHQIQPIGKYLILFGGIGENDKILNDMWAFDCEKEKWSALRPSGNSPSGRYGFASSSYSDIMVIWGGVGISGFLNDGYTYDYATNTFYMWEHGETIPAPREGACMAVYGQLIAIYGGMTSAGLSDELWIYDSETNEYKLIDSGNNDGPGALNHASCVITKNLDFYVMFGMQSQNALSEVFKYSFNQNYWTNVNNNIEDPIWSRFLSGILKIDDQVLIVGGQYFGISQNQQIFYLNLTSNKFIYLGDLPECAYAYAYAYYQNYFYLHGGGSAINQIAKTKIPTNKFFRIHLDENWKCSPGTYKTNICEICPPGTYSEDFGAEKCLKCWRGYYNPNYGASSGDMCYPCEEDTYNDVKGSADCLDCPSGVICKAGTLNYHISSASESDLSDQPSNYKADLDDANLATLAAQVTLGIIGFLIICFVVVSKSNSAFLVKIDLYTTYHNSTIGKAMFLLKTKFGGVFTMIFFILAIIIILDAVVNYLLNNIIELKSLIPLVVLDSMTTFEGNFKIKTTLLHYGGYCLEEKNCSSTIGYSIYNITGHWSDISCEVEDTTDCIISIECKKCSVLSQGLLSYSMTFTNGFTSGFRVQVNSTSSIPNEVSSIQTTVYPSKNRVFLGADPTIIYFSVIPSWYKDQKDGISDTGFHISLEKESSLGSMHKTNEMGIAFNSYLNIQLNKASNGLVTKRNIILTPIGLLSSLLGSIFGLMSSIGAIMQIAEKKWKEVEVKYYGDTPYDIAKNNSKLITKTYECKKFYDSERSRINSDSSIFNSDSPITLSTMKI